MTSDPFNQFPESQDPGNDQRAVNPSGAFEFSFMTDETQPGQDSDNAGISEQPATRRHRRRMSPQHIRRIKRRRRIRRALIGVGILLVVLLGLGAWFGVSALKAKDEVQQAVSVAQNMQDALTQGDMAALATRMDEFADHSSAAYKETSSVLWTVAAKLPVIGTDISVVRTAVTAMDNIASQAMPALKEAADTLNLNNISISNGTVSVPGLAESAEPLMKADSIIAEANRSVQTAPKPRIGMVAEAMDQAKEYLGSMADSIHNVSVFAQVAPKMLAMDGQTRTYLILAQTNAELRPSGGMPGSWGLMTVNNGTVDIQEFDSGASEMGWFDQPVVELTAEERSLFTDKLGRVPQDVNFTPDFPRTGQIAQAMWSAHTGVTVNGVIAIDPVFLQSMLAVTGGVTLPDGNVMDGTNTAQFLLSDVYAQQDVSDQDEYFNMAASMAFEHIMQNANNPRAFISAISDSIVNGHLLMWSADEDEQTLLEETAISGKLITDAAEPQAGVYFSDVTQSKMDWYLKREVNAEYQKEAANGAKQYTVRIKLTNMVTPEQVDTLPQYVIGDLPEGVSAGQIKTATFVYAPAGGRLVDWTMSDGSEFDGITVYEGLTLGTKTITLNPGESYEIVCHVQAAPGVTVPMTLRQTPQVEGRTD
ncbi:DUF4012 domain-containing protein [Bifidobacterium pullorum]|uniref:DUF4012 domain-containing protein n=1 Tax=Bifidobacterium pullorum TaxID=78448 RepID=UPI003AF9BC9A